jgi:tRNA uridine 5-carboxymethylaminomethyl modification enzyme
LINRNTRPGYPLLRVQTAFQVIVIGGGHAGVEAAWAAAHLFPVGPGERPTVALVTADPSKIGVMSCNPAIGGLAKGQIVREIDAMGGLMGLATDATGIQFKVLNTSKGEAVHGPRAQCDKHAYAEAVQSLIASRPEIHVIAGSVERLLTVGSRARGVVATGPHLGGTVELRAEAVVLTTGTFMRGLMHCGEVKSHGGRHGEHAAVGISGMLTELGFELGRLKTGTPPRLRRGSIRWEELPEQLGDDPPVPFSDLTEARDAAGRTGWRVEPREHTGGMDAAMHREGLSLDRFPRMPQVACRQTSTGERSHAVIRSNLHRAPMFSGQIESVGPRYCPSIEDKVVRFANRASHGVFLEPESLRDDWIYCNGIATSLPSDVQDVLVRAMPGCEDAEIVRYGYAVEYDMVRPHQIYATGMTKLVDGLFLAGQINGTSGYEEAAGQGMIAGINAARFALGHEPVTLGREIAYIGVMMDDLVTKTPREPYRMFTSRAEHRLLLRSDNAADRLTALARDLGILSSTALGRQRLDLFARRVAALKVADALLDQTTLDGLPLGRYVLSRELSPEVARRQIGAQHAASGQDALETGVLRTVIAERRYAPFIVRQRAEIRRHAELERKRLPGTVDYDAWPSLRAEARQSLARFRPATFGQAARLEGITPADLTLLSVLVAKHRAASGTSHDPG